MKSLTFIFLFFIFFIFSISFSLALPEPTIMDGSHWELTEYSGQQKEYFDLTEKQLSNTRIRVCLLPKIELSQNDPIIQGQTAFLKQGDYQDIVLPDDYEIEKEKGNVKKRCLDIDSINYNELQIGLSTIRYEWENQTWYIYDTDLYDKEGFYIEAWDGNGKILSPDIQWIEIEGTTKFFFNTTLPINDLVLRIWNNDKNLIFEDGEIMQEYECGGNQYYHSCEPHLVLNVNDILESPENNISGADVEEVSVGLVDWMQCFGANIVDWDEMKECMNTPRYFDINIHGTIYDTDPSLDLVYSASSDLIGIGSDFWGNKTEGSSLGARLDSTVLSMDFNEENVSGTIVDKSVYGNDGTIAVGTVTYNSSCSLDGSGCYEFAGDTNRLDIADDSSLTPLGGLTLSMWVNRDQNDDNEDVIAKNNEYRMKFSSSGTGKLDFTVYSGSSNYVNTRCDDFNAVDGWKHVTGTWLGGNDTSAFKLYINGVEGDNCAVTQTGTFGGIIIDSSNILYLSAFGNSNRFDGQLDNILVLPYGITQSEAVELYNGTYEYEVFPKYYIDKKGDFSSLIFYNSTSTLWNVTMNLADTYSTKTGVVNNTGINLSDTSLISYWKLDENYDDSARDNHGTQLGGVNNATGISSGAMRFDGIDDLINITDHLSDVEGYNQGTICFWDKGNETRDVILLSEGYDANNRLHVRVGAFTGSDTDETVVFLLERTNAYRLFFWSQQGEEAYNDNLWRHICIVTGGNNRIFINGQNDTTLRFLNGNSGTAEFSNMNNADSMYLSGGYFNDAMRHYLRNLDEVLIYNKSLTADEVLDIYKAGLSQHATTNITLETRTATSYNTTDKDLQAFFSFENDNATMAFDETGKFNATIRGSPNLSEENGTVGKGYYFDGSNDDIYVDDSTLFLNGSTALTMSGWFYPQTSGARDCLFCMRGASEYFLFYYDADGEHLVLQSTFGASLADGVYAPLDNMWHHITFVTNTTETYVYADGKLVQTGNAMTSDYIADDKFYIGLDDHSGARRFTGKVDEVRIYNRSLSASEAKSLYEMGSMHIEDWSAWQDEGIMSDGIPDTSTNEGNFFQFRPNFNTDDVDVSPYLINHSVGTGIPPPGEDITPPYFTTIPANVTLEYLIEELGSDFEATDEAGFDSYDVNWSDTFIINSTGYLTNSTLLSVGNHKINISINDTSNNINSTIYQVDVEDTTPPYFTTIVANGTLEYGTSLLADFEADDFHTLEGYDINDTTNFAINSTGDLINNTQLTLGTHKVNVSINDSYNNINYTIWQVIVQDTTLPHFTTVPANITLEYYIDSLGVDFDATDLLFDSYFINDTTNFGINQSGYLENATLLSIGSYKINASINDTTNNINFTIYQVDVTDTLSPSIDFVSPTLSNDSYSNFSYIVSNVTASDYNFSNMTHYLLNSDFSVNTTITSTSNQNYSMFTITTDGVYYINASAMDVSKNQNVTDLRKITIDTTTPVIDYEVPTETHKANLTRNNIVINVSVTETNEDTIIFYLYNETDIFNQSAFTSAQRLLNFTNVRDGNYTFNVTINDSAGNFNYTSNRNVTIDITPPAVQFVVPTPPSGSFSSSNAIDLNATAIDVRLDTLITYLYNSTIDLINTTVTYSSPNYKNITNLTDGLYYFNASANDTFGNYNSTVVGNVTLSNLTLDTVPPNVTITYPIHDQIYDEYPLPVNVTATDLTSSVDTKWITYDYGITNTTFIWNTTIPLVSTATYNLTVYANDSSSNVGMDSILIHFSLYDDTNATTECPDGYYLDGDGNCRISPANQTCLVGYIQQGFYANGTIICTQAEEGIGKALIESCPYKKYGYYNPKLVWMRKEGCI